MFNEICTEHARLLDQVRAMEPLLTTVGKRLAETVLSGRKLLICGNGGSAADAQHFAAEVIGRFETDRPAFPAIALTTDTSVMTAVANDDAFEQVFARQVAGLGCRADGLIAISTSGNSPNANAALMQAKETGLITVALLGKDGGIMAKNADYPVIVPGRVTARIQEMHILILHYWAGMIETAICRETEAI
ncbi:MAG: phosphoheptose isomerase [Deltaproteobacteria bacterium]|nr:MAG: phosphoheptose isomerase [Deltaproteobacteria bacterium]